MNAPAPSATTVHVASCVVPVTAPPIAGGAVAVRDGRIVGVGPAGLVRAEHPGEVVEWTGVVTPGLVNAHTHLQYTSFDAVGAAPFPTYVDWADRFIDEYAARRTEDWRATALAGIDAALACGTTAFGDVVTDEVAMDVLAAAGVAGVAYFEIIGVDAESWDGGVEAAVTRVLTGAPLDADAHVGLSPHAPYSVAAPVLRASAALARRLGVRIHTHLAEIDSEDELYRSATGAWAERLLARRRRDGRHWPQLDPGGSGLSAAEFAASCDLLGPDCHVAHGVYLDRAGRRLVADAGTSVALCPRSNLTVGSAAPPVADMLREGVPFCVGTDSLGSNTSLDLLADVALLHELAVEGGYDADDLGAQLLAAATVGGAVALGLGTTVGALQPGRRADLAVWDVDPDPRRAVDAIVTAGAGRCVASVVRGVTRAGG